MYILVNMTTINIRIDEHIKDKASLTLSKLGLDMSSAIKMFLVQVINEKEIPFIPSINQKKIKARWDAEVKDAKKNAQRFSNAQDLIDSILK